MVNLKVVMMAFAMILMLAGMPVSVQAQNETGLVGEWHFDGDAKDSSGNGNDGTISGATFVEGKVGKALSFDGVDDYVDAGNNPSLNLSDPLTVGTWELWIKPQTNYCKNIAVDFIRKGHSYELDAFCNGHISMSDFALWREGRSDHVLETSGSYIKPNIWQHIAGVKDITNLKIYHNGELKETLVISNGWDADSENLIIGAGGMGGKFAWFFNGLIDEVRIYNRALSAEEIKTHYEQGQTTLTVKKEASPYSIRQYQTTNVTIQIKNTGISEIRDIEVTDSTNSNLELIGGEFPNPKKYNSLSTGESREIRYILKSKESGTFILNPATVSYVDNTENIKVVKSEPVSLTVVPSSEGSPEISSPSDIGSSSAVLLHGEKTDVVLGEDILLKLSAVNLITKPPMSVQVMIYPPSGMSVTGSDFVKSGAGIYTTTYNLNPGDGKDIEVHIKSNQVGDFNVKGRIVYYFGEEKDKAEDHTLNLPIKVRKEIGSNTEEAQTPAKNSIPGFELFTGISGLFLLAIILKVKR